MKHPPKHYQRSMKNQAPVTLNQLAEFIYNSRNHLKKDFEDRFFNASNIDIKYSSQNHILSALHDSEVERIARHAHKNSLIKGTNTK